MVAGGLFVVDEWSCNSQAFFLTHMHSDHTKGLSARWCKGPLYCSSISATLLLAKFPGFDHSLIHVLPVGSPSLVALRDKREQSRVFVEVTLIDADHCPGAVMYVFRGDFGCFLHTGDFRWETDGICPEKLENRRRQLLAAVGGTRVDCLYLDNTFCNARFSFPPRHIAAQQVVDIIASHRGYDVVVGVDTLGKEELLVCIAEAFKTKIWIWPERLQTMRLLGLPDVFTTDTTATRIRAVPRYSISIETLRMLNEIRPTIAVVPTGSWCLCKNFSTSSSQLNGCQSKCCCGSIHTSMKVGSAHGVSVFSERQTKACVPERMSDDCGQVKARNCSVRVIAGEIYLVSYSLHSCFSELKDFVEFTRPISLSGILKSSDCDINPCHHFHHLCHIRGNSSKQFSSSVDLSSSTTNRIGHFEVLNSLVENVNPHMELFNIREYPHKAVGRKKLGKATRIRSGHIRADLRKRRPRGGLICSDITEGDE